MSNYAHNLVKIAINLQYILHDFSILMRMAHQLGKKDAARRLFILEGDMWNVLFTIGLPLVFYNGISQFFQFFDTIIASNMSANVVSTVSFISQIQSMLAAIGSGLGISGGIIIARFYGAGNMEEVNKNISTIVFLALGIGLALLAVILPFSVQFLRFFGMPEDLITAENIVYFMFEIAGLVSVFINTIYFAIERAKGKTKTIFWFNMLVLAIKFCLTLFFVYVLKKGIIMLSLSSFIAQSLLTIIAIRSLADRKNPFRISWRYADFSVSTLKPMLLLALPVFLEKFVFNYGKVVVNSMGAVYGSMAIGALGVSNRLGGLSTMPPIGLQEAESSIISQNLGNKNINRALGIFKRVFVVNMLFGVASFIAMSVFMDPIITLFARGNPEFSAEIAKIYNWERYATILLAASSSVMGLLYGFGYTRISMILNMLRLFAFRIPPLWYFQNFTDLGAEGLGVAMMISNLMVGVSATVVAWFLIKKIRQKQKDENDTATIEATDCAVKP